MSFLLPYFLLAFVAFGQICKIMRTPEGIALHGYIHTSVRLSFEFSSLCMQWTTWFHVVSLPVLLCFFWIDLFPSIGGSDGLLDFLSKFENIWVCHFTNTCSVPANLGFYIPLFWLLFLYISNLLIYRFYANPLVVVGNACLAIPLLNIFYGSFHVGQSEVEFKGTTSPASLVSMITFPMAYVVLSCYHKASQSLSLLDDFDVY